MKIYTKTGDQGTTSLVGGVRIDKSHARIEAYGTIDELNSALGYLLSLLPDGVDVTLLERVQHELFNIGTHLATDREQRPDAPVPPLDPSNVTQLEAAIDQMQAQLPPQAHFILPGGTPAAAWAHVCRTICRRAERRVVSLSHLAEVPSLPYNTLIGSPIIYSFWHVLSTIMPICRKKLGKTLANNNKSIIFAA